MLRFLPSFVALALIGAAGVAPAHAQELMATNVIANSVLFPSTPLVPVSLASAAAIEAKADGDTRPTFVRATFTPRSSRPSLLPALYAAQAALQAMDAHSTYSAISRGGYEANPLMKGVVGNKGAMMAVKAGVAASTIFMAEKMWRRGNRAGAIATMLLANGVTAAVVANNYRVASSLR
jgi:hypothetical protein